MFVPTVTALVCLALGVLAFLAYLRYATTHLFYPVAFALTCWAEMLFNFGFLLALPGLVGSGGVVGDTPSASGYMFLFGLLALPIGLGTAHLVPANRPLARRPHPDQPLRLAQFQCDKNPGKLSLGDGCKLLCQHDRSYLRFVTLRL